MIYTSYFANVGRLPLDVHAISIAAKAPEGWAGAEYRRLAPPYEVLLDWKKYHEERAYARQYKQAVLDKYHPESVVREIMQLTPEGKIPCLICYEKPGEFCHRHLVADWLDEAGYEIGEIGVGY